MKSKKITKLGIVAVVTSVLPFATFIPVVLHITLSNAVRSVWAGVNILSVFIGLILSVICIKNRDNRSVINIISMIVGSIWLLLMIGIVVLALFISFVH